MTEKLLRLPSGWPIVPVFLLVLPGAVATLIVLAAREHNFLPYGLAAVFVGVVWLVGLPGFLVVNPNEARVCQLFGRYVGTVSVSQPTSTARGSSISHSRTAMFVKPTSMFAGRPLARRICFGSAW